MRIEQIRENKKQYLDLVLGDKTGEITGKKWDVSDDELPSLMEIKEGDVCLMSFKVKVNSGEGYVKPWVQDNSSKKALFAETKVGSDWTECYLPFTGIADIRDAGIRFGGKVQNISIKDFMIENFYEKSRENRHFSVFFGLTRHIRFGKLFAVRFCADDRHSPGGFCEFRHAKDYY